MDEKIQTEEAKVVTIIFTDVQNEKAKVLFYQCVFHLELFKTASRLLKEAKAELDFHNFARSQSCHMIEGIFGAEHHAARMETAKVKTMGYLGVTLSSGHKFLRSLLRARKNEPRVAWKTDKKRLERLEDDFRQARNAYEHLDEALDNGENVASIRFSFSIHNRLDFMDKSGTLRELDFSATSLQIVPELWMSTISVLRSQ